MASKRPASESHPAKRVCTQVELPQDCWSWVILWMDDMRDVASLRCVSKTLRDHVEHFDLVVRQSLRTPLDLSNVINVDSGSAFLLPNGRLDGPYESYMDKRNCDGDSAEIYEQHGTFVNGQLHGTCSMVEASRDLPECTFVFGRPWNGIWDDVVYEYGREVRSMAPCGKLQKWVPSGPHLTVDGAPAFLAQRKEQPPHVQKRHVIHEHVPVYHYHCQNTLTHATTVVTSLADAAMVLELM